MKNSYIAQAWLVIALGLCFGAALAGVQATLKPRIEANKLNDTIGQIPNLVPGATSGKAETFGEQIAYRAMDGEGQHVGWVLAAAGQGFADRIEVLVGLDQEARTVTGLYILANQETPGLGNKITEDGWRGQFAGKPAAQALVVTKSKAQKDNEIEAITGATISSESVAGIVNAAVAKFRAALKDASS
ncbi:MAG: FMN-binding protein [Kiritimatiellae bacterium]|nr:FMN-binding protein [Kiritimatiellia bacterium]